MVVEEGYAEVFEFLWSDREDLRKMAVRGLAEQSKDNASLFAFLSAPEHGPRCVDALLQLLHPGAAHLLGDVLTILINCCAEGGCAETLVRHKAVGRAMRLLDALEASDQTETSRRVWEEMTLMLLSNLTASHIAAVDDLLRAGEAEMRGFYLSKLLTLHTRFALDGDGRAARDLRRWVLQIALNTTRAGAGQEALLEDEDWVKCLTECLGAPNPTHRALGAMCYRNCVLQSERHAAVLRGECVRVCVERLSDGSEADADTELILAEIVAGVMTSEEGMAFLEEVNAKKHLQAAITGRKLRETTVEFVTRHVLPFLDDVIDAYVVPGSDAID